MSRSQRERLCVNTVGQGIRVVRHLGVGWAWFRLRYAAGRRLGRLQRACPAAGWARLPAPEPTRWFAGRPAVGGGARTEADEILAGRFRLFSHHHVAAGPWPDWHRNQLTGEAVPGGVHWSRLGDFAFGDIKGVWELSRFGWAYALGRAYATTGDNAYAERFWALFDHWRERNPPNLGPNWMCGQEATFRLMAAIFAADACEPAAATTEGRRGGCQEFIAVTGARIAGNLAYALSQSNNHGVSECVGLITCALRRPDLPAAARWRRRGEAALRRQLAALVYADGAFAQHSANYHRVLLHDLLWLLAAYRRQGGPAPEWLAAATRRALRFITVLTSRDNGQVPLYGANDGANVLSLADADYLDFRPVIQAGYAVLERRRFLPPGPWDEAADWLADPGWREDAANADTPGRESGRPAEQRRHFPDGGCLVWRDGHTRVFFRCPTAFAHRPSQADMLHVDLEWMGQRVALDAGTFSYNTRGMFQDSLKSAAVHNTVTFDGEEPIGKVGRFLFLPWPRGRAGWVDDEVFEASHDAWNSRQAGHVRSVELRGDCLVVRDRLRARGRRARLHWLLCDCLHTFEPETGSLMLQTPRGLYRVRWRADGARATLTRASPDDPHGWWSPYYHAAAPALSLAIDFAVDGEAEATTTLAPQPA